MIDLYTWPTPNGKKISIALEELQLPYQAIEIDINAGDQYDPAFLQISPNNKIPAIFDHDTGISLMESGAILLYLARKTGSLMAAEGQEYWQTVEWLMWQKANLGPMLGQVHHFVRFNAGKAPYAEERYLNEARRLYRVLETRLQGQKFIVGNEYSIADIASWPWIARFQWQTMDMTEFPSVRDWYCRIAERPAVRAGYSVPLGEDIPLPD